MTHTILIIDDDARHRSLYAQTLEAGGLSVVQADCPAAARAVLEGRLPAMVISDVQMPGQTGLSFLEEVRQTHADLPFLLVTAFPDIRDAVTALKLGAVDYLQKPVDLDELLAAVQHTLGLSENLLPDDLPPNALDGVVAESPVMRSLFQDCYRVARSDATVLLTGESGTGKEVLTAFIHRHSHRKDERLVPVNCAAIPANLLASELFGHEAGAFTGADQSRPGRFREADQGTLFLDEIGDLPLELQPTLLRAIESGTVAPLGSDTDVNIDVRLIAATNQDLQAAVDDGSFRQDLFYRLNVIAFEIPPLRERPEDVLPLARHFLRDGGARLSPAASRLLQGYPWPGNVRELANAMERAHVLASSEVILPEHLPPSVRKPAAAETTAGPVTTLEAVERDAIRKALEQTNDNRTKAAELLGISRRTLIYKLKRMREEK